MVKCVDSHCRAFQLAIDVLGRPWTALILNILQAGPQRFSELAESAKGLGDKVLSARLKELEARGLVSREVDAGPPVKVTYSLTACGRSFENVAIAIEKWGRTFAAEAKPAKRRAKRARARVSS